MNRKGDSEHGAILRANVDRLLKLNGWSEPDFCKRLGITKQSYSVVFRGRNGPGMRTIHRWAGLLGVDMSELVKEGIK